jgi:hypothetical protein
MKGIWRFGMIGTFFSIIVVYFIYKYAEAQHWILLSWLAWIYLVIWAVIIGLALSVLIISLVVMLFVTLYTYVKYRKLRKKHKAKVVDAEYRIKE